MKPVSRCDTGQYRDSRRSRTTVLLRASPAIAIEARNSVRSGILTRSGRGATRRATCFPRRETTITLPEPIAATLDARPDDVLVFETDPEQPRTARIHLIPRTLAGALTGVLGTTEEVKAFLRDEHAAWGA